jgi:hypothetical protein
MEEKKEKKMATASSISTFGHSEQRDKKERKASIQKRKNSIPMRGILLISFGK